MAVVLAWGCCCCCCCLLRRLLRLPALLCCEAMVWALTFLAFPLRMLPAVDRERKLGGLIGEMQAQMEDLVWQNGQLQEKLRAALREQEAMEAVLDEMEEEHDDAFARIQALEAQLKALRQENTRLNEHKGKSMWDRPPPPSHKASVSEEKPSGGEQGARAEEDPASVVALATTPPVAPSSSVAAAEDALAASRVVARRRSLFSLGLSLAVGAVAWSADAPCLPLLAGLFAVVGVSMRSVSRSCAALRRGGPAADAVALLSLNWFLLGVLISPMLPALARALVPRAGRALGPALASFAAATPMPMPM